MVLWLVVAVAQRCRRLRVRISDEYTVVDGDIRALPGDIARVQAEETLVEHARAIMSMLSHFGEVNKQTLARNAYIATLRNHDSLAFDLVPPLALLNLQRTVY